MTYAGETDPTDRSQSNMLYSQTIKIGSTDQFQRRTMKCSHYKTVFEPSETITKNPLYTLYTSHC